MTFLLDYDVTLNSSIYYSRSRKRVELWMGKIWTA